MADYISRDYTVENMENYPWDTEHDKNAAIHLVRELVPPADVVEVVRCKDCKHYKEGKLLDHVTDYISREAALDAVDVCNLHRGIIDALQSIISDIPAADVVPLPEGHGRLGDLDALQDEFKKFHDGKRSMLIDTAPTIVPAEGCG